MSIAIPARPRISRGGSPGGLPVTLALAALVLAGCTADPGPPGTTAAPVGTEVAPSTPAAAVPIPTVPPGPTPPHAPTVAPSPGPDVPVELTELSDAGAKAAAEYFTLQMIETQLAMDAAEWRRRTAEHCWICSWVTRSVEGGGQITGEPATVRGEPVIVGRDDVAGIVAVDVPFEVGPLVRVGADGARSEIWGGGDAWFLETQMAFGPQGWVLVNGQLHNDVRQIEASSIRVASLDPPAEPDVYDEAEAVETAARFLETVGSALSTGILDEARDLTAATCWNCRAQFADITGRRERGETVVGGGMTPRGGEVLSRTESIGLVVVRTEVSRHAGELTDAGGAVLKTSESAEAAYLVVLKHSAEGWFVTEFWIDRGP